MSDLKQDLEKVDKAEDVVVDNAEEEDDVEEISSSHIQMAQSTPPYISTFINNNLQQLNKIYEEGLQVFGCGILGFQCSQKNNKMDVQFMNEEHICETMQPDSWGKLKQSIPSGKKLFMIMDHDINSMFLVYI